MKLLYALVKPHGSIKAYIRWTIIRTKEADGLTTLRKMKKGNKDFSLKNKQRNLKAKLEDNPLCKLSMIRET